MGALATSAAMVAVASDGVARGERGEPGVGVSLALAGGAEREYRAAPLGQQRAAPTLLVPAKEYLNEKRREV